MDTDISAKSHYKEHKCGNTQYQERILNTKTTSRFLISCKAFKDTVPGVRSNKLTILTQPSGNRGRTKGGILLAVSSGRRYLLACKEEQIIARGASNNRPCWHSNSRRSILLAERERGGKEGNGGNERKGNS